MHGTWGCTLSLSRIGRGCPYGYTYLYIVGVGASSCFLSLMLWVSEDLKVQGYTRSNDTCANFLFEDVSLYLNVYVRLGVSVDENAIKTLR